MFTHPYTKIEFVQRDLAVSRVTATKYLDALAEGGFVRKHKIGRGNCCINLALNAGVAASAGPGAASAGCGMTEDQLEQECLGWLANLGRQHRYGPDLAPDGSTPERSDCRWRGHRHK